MLDEKKLSTSYQVRKLTAADANKAFALVQSNPLYFAYCPPQATRHSILEDMQVVPADKTLNDKFYLGYFDQGKLIAIVDMIANYPDPKTAWLGFFMTDSSVQRKGVGSSIMSELVDGLKDFGIERIELDYPKGLEQAEKFLLKNEFVKDGREIPVPGYTVVVMERQLTK